MQTECVEIHEDNSGAVYLTRGGECWALGPVTPDMEGRAASDARGWVEGEWGPNEADGQRPADLDGLDHIATWTADGLVIGHGDTGELVAGAGGAAYLGVGASR
ncbi:hypothetical protein F0L68_40350 [Solihabitans fulvus]|uniref:Uncharacterized protein n=1 Tax=Solihabitans fulvus TaxID=1892852 RepID=A0A5B2W5V2_9PSEU|nr:hypothetical protein [Solihabitans fulvus]KAA2247171.1 hypothetical protein F0L68_40350 [Solihabitans fulvus]